MEALTSERYSNLSSSKMYRAYQYFQETGDMDKLVRTLVPLYNTKFREQTDYSFSDNTFEDSMQEFLIDCVLVLNKKTLNFNDPGGFYNYFETIAKRHIYKLFNQNEAYINYVDPEQFEILTKYYSDNYYSINKVLNKLELKQLVKDLVNLYNRKVRFGGKIKSSCLYVFDCIMKSAEPDYDILEYHYDVKDPYFIIQYSNIIFKSCLYDLKIRYLPDLISSGNRR